MNEERHAQGEGNEGPDERADPSQAGDGSIGVGDLEEAKKVHTTGERHGEQRPSAQRWPKVRKKVVQVLTLLVAAVALVIYFFQWWAMYGQLTEMKDSVRPWLAIEPVSMPTPGPSPGVLVFRLVNAGGAPGMADVVLREQTIFGLFPESPPPARQRPWLQSDTLVVPGETITGTFQTPSFAKHGLAILERGGYRLYVYGVVSYREVTTKKTHATQFCMFYDPPHGRMTNGLWSGCHTYNGAT